MPAALDRLHGSTPQSGCAAAPLRRRASRRRRGGAAETTPAGGRDRAAQQPLDARRLRASGRDQHDRARLQDRRHPHRQRFRRHLLADRRRTTRRCAARSPARARRGGSAPASARRRLVEADVAVRADAEDLQIDAAGAQRSPARSARTPPRVRRRAVEEVDALRRAGSTRRNRCASMNCGSCPDALAACPTNSSRLNVVTRGEVDARRVRARDAARRRARPASARSAGRGRASAWPRAPRRRRCARARASARSSERSRCAAVLTSAISRDVVGNGAPPRRFLQRQRRRRPHAGSRSSRRGTPLRGAADRQAALRAPRAATAPREDPAGEHERETAPRSARDGARR